MATIETVPGVSGKYLPIERIPVEELSYERFCRDFMGPRIPFILTGCDAQFTRPSWADASAYTDGGAAASVVPLALENDMESNTVNNGTTTCADLRRPGGESFRPYLKIMDYPATLNSGKPLWTPTIFRTDFNDALSVGSID